MKKTLALLILLFVLISCSRFGSGELHPITIASNSIDLKLVKAFQKEFNKTKLNFIEDQQGFDKFLELLESGKIDAFLTSTDLPLKEDLEKFLIAKDGIAIVTNQANPVSDLYQFQLAEIFSFRNKTWNSYSKFKQPILVVDHEKDDPTRAALFMTLFGSERIAVSNTVKIKSDKEVLESVKKYPNAISFISFSELKEGMKAIGVDNIPANKKNIEKGYYPIARKIYLYYKPQLLIKKKSYDSLKAFIQFIYSDKGQDIISAMNYMPLSKTEIEAIQLEANPIYIAVSAPLDGPYTDLGKAVVNSAKLAVDEFNNAGGIGGKKVELVVCNDKATVVGALDCANDFVRQGVVAVIGHLTSQASIEASKVYVENNIVQITPGSTHPWFTERPGARGFVFRTIGRDDRQARLIAKAIENLDIEHPSKISIFHNDSIYANTLASLINNEVSKIDQDKVVEIIPLEQGKSQFHKEVNNLKSKVLVFVGEYGDAAQLMKELALSNKKDIIFIGADGTFSQRFIDEAGLRSEGAFVTGSTVNTESKLTQEFIDNFKEKYKMDASAFAMNSYDAAQIILSSLKEKALTNTSLEKAVSNIKHQGITGEIYFNNLGDPVLPRMAIYQVQGGKFVRVSL